MCAERSTEKVPVVPTTRRVQTKKKPPSDVAIVGYLAPPMCSVPKSHTTKMATPPRRISEADVRRPNDQRPEPR